MNREDYAELTDQLVSALRDDRRVLGLVALGSMAATVREPDEWSDHDFWVVTKDGEADDLRSDTGWLPRPDDIVVTFAETTHGRSVIYADGHLVEYAVFEDHELEIARANLHRVLIDRCDLDRRMRDMAGLTLTERTAVDPTGSNRLGSFLAQITIGVTRQARGELLSANHLVRGWAANTLTSLLASFVEPEREAQLDNLDSTRRFEQGFPTLGGEIDRALNSPTLECAQRLVEVARRELTGVLPAATNASFDAIQATLDRAHATATG